MIPSPRARVENVEATSTQRRASPRTIIASAFGVPLTKVFRRPGRSRPSLDGRGGGARQADQKTLDDVFAKYCPQAAVITLPATTQLPSGGCTTRKGSNSWARQGLEPCGLT
jgi:hypothetical protein